MTKRSDDAKSPALHVADRHGFIRVHGARTPADLIAALTGVHLSAYVGP